jgi:phage gp29-like protein
MADNKPGAVERIAAAAGRMIDQFGKSLSRAEVKTLETQIAAPSNFTPRAPFAGHLAFGINPQRLGVLIRGADQGSTRDWFILCEEIEELYPHYSAVLAKRRRQVSLLPVTVVAAEGVADAEKHSDFVRRWLAKGVLQRAMFDVTDAIGKG